MATREPRVRADDLDLSRHVRPGDRVVFAQSSGEPVGLTRRLVAQADEIGPFEIFMGASFSGVFRPDAPTGIAFVSYGALGENRRLMEAGRLGVLPCNYAQIAGLFGTPALRPSVVLLEVSAPDMQGIHSLGLAHDYVLAAARRARTVIVCVNDQVPWTHGAELPPDLEVAAWCSRSGDIARVPAAEPAPPDLARVAAVVADRLPDGATIELGTGSLAEAVLTALKGHRDLGVHTGVVGDGIIELIETGAITNARKGVDAGITVTALLAGSVRLDAFAHRNPAIRVAPSTYTHGAEVLARLRGFFGINGAVEVDLTGQVGAEALAGRYVGAVGGHPDFTRVAHLSPEARSVVALTSTARSGRVSRIVPRLVGPVTTARSDVDMVATEFGLAELRGQPVAERARRLTAIAHPDFREDLARAAARIDREGW